MIPHLSNFKIVDRRTIRCMYSLYQDSGSIYTCHPPYPHRLWNTSLNFEQARQAEIAQEISPNSSMSSNATPLVYLHLGPAAMVTSVEREYRS